MTNDAASGSGHALPSEIAVDRGSITVRGKRIGLPITSARLAEILGAPSQSIQTLPNTPFGHKSPVRHCYSDIGVSFLESHNCDRIVECNCVLRIDRALFKPARLCAVVLINGVKLTADTGVDDLKQAFAAHMKQVVRNEFALRVSDHYVSISVRGTPPKVVGVSISLESTSR
jgi:hypothetical protein